MPDHFFLYLSVPMYLFPCLLFYSFAVSRAHAHMHKHTHQQSSLPLCAACVVKPLLHEAGKTSITSLPTILLSADQRAAKQPETTVGARVELAQQHN